MTFLPPIVGGHETSPLSSGHVFTHHPKKGHKELPVRDHEKWDPCLRGISLCIVWVSIKIITTVRQGGEVEES